MNKADSLLKTPFDGGQNPVLKSNVKNIGKLDFGKNIDTKENKL